MAVGGSLLDKFTVELGFDDQRGETLDRVEQQAERVKRRMQTLANVFAGAGAALTAMGIAGLRAFSGVERQMAIIEGLAGVTKDELAAWTPELQAISRESGIGFGRLVQGLYDVASGGFRGDEAMQTMRTSATLAIAGLGDVNDIAKTLLATYNAFGKRIPIEQIGDQLAKAVQLGTFDPKEVGVALPRILQTSAEFDIAPGETLGMLSALSLSGVNASEGINQLRQAMQLLIKPSRMARKELAKLGLTEKDLAAAASADGFMMLLKTLQTAVGGDKNQLARVFQGVEGIGAVFALVGKNAERSGAVVDAVLNDYAGMAEKAAVPVRDTLSLAWDRVKARAELALVAIGAAVKPYAMPVLAFAGALLDVFGRLPTPIMAVVAAVIALGPALIGAGVALKILARSVGVEALSMRAILATTFAPFKAAALSAFGAVRVGVLFLMTPFRALYAAVAAQGAWGAMSAGAAAAFARVRAVGLAAAAPLQVAWTRLRLTLAFGGVAGLAATAFATIKAAGLGAFRAVSIGARLMWIGISGPMAPVMLAIMAGLALLIVAWKPLSTFVKGFFAGLRDGFGVVRTAMGGLLDALGPIGTGIRAVFNGIGKAVRWLINLFGDQSEAGRSAGEAVGGALASMLEKITGVVTFVTGLPGKMFDAGAAIMRAIAEGVKSATGAVWGAVKGAFGKLGDLLPGSDAREGPLAGLTAAGQAIVDTIADGVRRARPLEVAVAATLALPSLAPIQQVVEQVTEAVTSEPVQQVVEGITAPEVIPTVAPVAPMVLAPIQQVVQQVTEAVTSEPVRQAVEGITAPPPVQQVVEGVVEPAPPLVPPALEPIRQVVEQVTEAVAAAPATPVAPPVLEPIRQVVQQVTEAVATAPVQQVVEQVAAPAPPVAPPVAPPALEPIRQVVQQVTEAVATAEPIQAAPVQQVAEGVPAPPVIEPARPARHLIRQVLEIATAEPVQQVVEQVTGPALQPVEQLVRQVVDQIAAPAIAPVEQLVRQVVDQIAAPAIAPVEQLVRQVVEPARDVVRPLQAPSDFAPIRDVLALTVPNLGNLAAPLPVAPPPAPAAGGGTTIELNVTGTQITVNAPAGSDGAEIGEIVKRQIGEAFRGVVEQADDRVRA